MTTAFKKGIPFATYAASTAVNWSTLKHMRDSALDYLHATTTESKDTTGRARGRYLHTLVFEPEKAGDEYAIFPGETRRGKEWEAFKAANEGKAILKAEEAEEVQAQAAAVRNHPAIQPYLEGGSFEVSLKWTDPETGLECKGRMDWWHAPSRTLIDLKGTSTIHPHYFARIVARQGYHCQLAHYANGIKAATGREPAQVVLLAACTKPPFDIGPFLLSGDDLYAGGVEVADLLRKVKECRESGQYPGRYQSLTPLTLPAYIWGDDENPDELGVEF